MPATVFMVEIRDGFDVSTRSNIFPESSWVGSFTILTSPNSPTISISLLCFAAVCWFVAHTFSQLMAGRFRSPARMTYLTRFNKIAIPNNKFQMASGQESHILLRVQKCYHLCVACSDHISVNSIFKHIHTTSINTIIWQFVPFIYHHL